MTVRISTFCWKFWTSFWLRRERILAHAGKGKRSETDASGAAGDTLPDPLKKPPGHGRHGAHAYRGAKTIHVPLTESAGDL